MIIDALGYKADEPGFRQINRFSWIDLERTDHTGAHLYQKVVDNMLMPLVVSTGETTYAPTYRRWREEQEGRPYAEILKRFDTMTQKKVEE